MDDVEWIALAQLRMYETTADDKYFLTAKQLYNDWIWSTWGSVKEEPRRGGINWKTDVKKLKKACFNSPDAIIATHIYAVYDKIDDPGKKLRRAYLREEVKIYS